MVKAYLAAALIGLGACSTPTSPLPVAPVEAVRVDVPVPVKRAPPAELTTPYAPADYPVFVAPSDPRAASALTPENEKRLRTLVYELITRVNAWEAWATSE